VTRNSRARESQARSAQDSRRLPFRVNILAQPECESIMPELAPRAKRHPDGEAENLEIAPLPAQ